MRWGDKFALLFLPLLIGGCATTTSGLKSLQEPEPEKALIVGCVLIENINQRVGFENWDYGAEVVIVGRTTAGELVHFTAQTDANGYFAVPNAARGQYALKAVVLPVPGSLPIKLVNDLSSLGSRFYRMRHPERPIEYSAEWLPPASSDRVINLGVIWLGLRAATISDMSSKSIGEILMARTPGNLDGRRFYDGGYPYTRENPLTFFKKKFPNSTWWRR